MGMGIGIERFSSNWLINYTLSGLANYDHYLDHLLSFIIENGMFSYEMFLPGSILIRNISSV